MSRHGGKLLVDQLVVHGADTVFSVPGESFLALLDGFYESPIRLITCRHEGGAANMADAYGKLTGRPGIAVVTRGPGATQASVGVHTAFQDSTPLILLVGQVASDQEEREAFQEVDYRRMFGPMAKWVAQIDRVDRIPEYIARAFATACAGRPGPVVLALPEDMLASDVDAADARAVPRRRSRIRARRRSSALRGAARSGRAPARSPRRRRAGRRAPRTTCGSSSRRTRFRPARRSAGRTRSTTTRRAMSATSASASTRSSRHAFARPTCCSSSGRGSAR